MGVKNNEKHALVLNNMIIYETANVFDYDIDLNCCLSDYKRGTAHIDNLIDIFLNKNIPFELLNSLLSYKGKLKDSLLKKEDKKKIAGFLFSIFDDNLKNSTNLTVNLYELINKIKKTSTVNDIIFKEREILKLSANLFYYLAKLILYIVKKSFSEGEVKINLIRKMNDRIIYYEKILGNTIKTKNIGN